MNPDPNKPKDSEFRPEDAVKCDDHRLKQLGEKLEAEGIDISYLSPDEIVEISEGLDSE
jgi:hypothetical protein